MSEALKPEVIKLTHPEIKLIEITDINTHPLRAVDTNELYFVEYIDREIQKMVDNGQINSMNTYQTNYINFKKAYKQT